MNRLLRLVPNPDIKITKAYCGTFANGFCFSALNPFYSGHYETLEEALEAAERTRANQQLRRD